MTEAEWLASDDPTPMLALGRRETGDRKLRLFAVACCRRIWPLIRRQQWRRAVEAAEGVADRTVSEQQRRVIQSATFQALKEHRRHSPAYSALRAARVTYYCLEKRIRPSKVMTVAVGAASGKCEARGKLWARRYHREKAATAHLLRDVFGNPFRPVTADPAWLTSTVVSLAQTIYEERAFDRLPILADALEDAGCDSAEVLAHCRGEGPHVRGCWAIDMLLGKV
jgi:hypothetical protein